MTRLMQGTNDLLTLRPELAKEWDYQRNDPDRPEHYTAYSNEKVWWLCGNGHSWLARIDNRSHGNGCPYCGHCERYIRRLI